MMAGSTPADGSVAAVRLQAVLAVLLLLPLPSMGFVCEWRDLIKYISIDDDGSVMLPPPRRLGGQQAGRSQLM
jgi:hypothetical protein